MADEIDHEQLEGYVREVADALGLRDWQFHVEQFASGEQGDAHADVTLTPGRRVAAIRFFDPFRESVPATQRTTVVHELIHAHLNRVLDALDPAEKLIGEPAYRAIYHAMDTRMEEGTDAIAEAVAGFFPMPPWAREEKSVRQR